MFKKKEEKIYARLRLEGIRTLIERLQQLEYDFDMHREIYKDYNRLDAHEDLAEREGQSCWKVHQAIRELKGANNV
jgi:hypothetical protein